MFVARLICSDTACASELSSEARSAAELEALICDCGCALEIVGWADWVDEPAEVVVLRPGGHPLRDAA